MDLLPSGPRWYAVQCKTREESRAHEHLERQGFPCYRPTLAVEKLWNRRRIESRESLFPGYLFVQLDAAHDDWHPIHSTRGVLQIVRCRERPLPIRDEIIAAIQARISNDQPRVPYLMPGDRVMVRDGGFLDVEAIFLANDGEQRVMLLMHILNREQQVSFPVSSVRKVRERGSFRTK